MLDLKMFSKRKRIILLLASVSFVVICCVVGICILGKGKSEEIRTVDFSGISIGDYVTFGTYEQDNIEKNGTEPIEWLVLDIQDGKALLLSRYGLECKEFDGYASNWKAETISSSWKASMSRSWLNGTFHYNAFNEEEKEYIVKSKIDTIVYPYENVQEIETSEDYLFLLSSDELKKYFPDKTISFEKEAFNEDEIEIVWQNTDWTTLPTEHARSQGAEWHDGYQYENCWWWLRSHAFNERYSSLEYVIHDGRIVAGMGSNDDIVLRPALWVTLDSGDFTTGANESGENIKDIKDAKVGDSISLGTYEQDGNLENGEEEIEWVVLDKQNGKALVISKYALDCVEYNDNYYGEITWESCSLRKWLNDDFYNSSFEKEEQSRIIETVLENHDNQVTGASGGNRTRDKVFVLSIDEATQYFSSDPDKNDSARRAKLTEYAKAQGGFCYSKSTMGDKVSPEYEGAGVWWLRTPAFGGGHVLFRPADVKYDGCVIQEGCPISGHVVRPAMWIAY